MLQFDPAGLSYVDFSRLAAAPGGRKNPFAQNVIAFRKFPPRL
jgi:hypothetical protein